MRKCGRFSQHIDDYVTGHCARETARWMAEHAARCPGCQAEETAARAMRSLVRAEIERAQTQESCRSEPFLSALHGRIDERAALRSLRPHATASVPVRDRLRVALFPLTAAAAALYLGLLCLSLRPWGAAVEKPAILVDQRPRADVALRGPKLASENRRHGDAETRRWSEPRHSRVAEPTATTSPLRRPSSPHLGYPRVAWVISASPRLPALPPPGDDLAALNADPVATARQWTALPREQWQALEARVRRTIQARDDFVLIPFPRLADASGRQIAAAVRGYEREAAVIDGRLAREVSVQQKGTALADLCDRLRADTGIHLTAGRSVADEKVTVFCDKMPLREVMRQLSRPFSYTWLRSGASSSSPNAGGEPTGYRYELVQDLRSQLVEEELRNRDRHQSLIALEREIERYRPYLGISPDEALARVEKAPPAERRLFERLSGTGWGAMQLYHRLTPQDLAALRAGEELVFAEEPGPGEQPLPPGLAKGVLQSNRRWRLIKQNDHYSLTPDHTDPRAVPLTADPDARAKVTIGLRQSELGTFTLHGTAGVFPTRNVRRTYGSMDGEGPLAMGVSPAVVKPDNKAANAKLAGEPGLRRRATVRPRPSYRPTIDTAPAAPPPSGQPVPPPFRTPTPGSPAATSAPSPAPASGTAAPPEPKATSADVLAALHQATGIPIVADYYTRLHPLSAVSPGDLPLFDALNQLADPMRMRWAKDGSWIQFRTTSYYDDRLKEVPNRLLERWSAARRRSGALALDDLVEIAQLSDTQLDAASMAEGAREIYGLAEWDLVRTWPMRPHLRFLAELTPAQRQETMSPAGLAFTRMTLPQQQRYIALALEGEEEPLQSIEELAGATLRVDYTLPGWYEWRVSGPPALQWVVPLEPTRDGRRVLRPPCRERTREATLQAAQRLGPELWAAIREVLRHYDPRAEALQRVEDVEIVPTRANLTIVYIPGATNRRGIHVLRPRQNLRTGTWMPGPSPRS